MADTGSDCKSSLGFRPPLALPQFLFLNREIVALRTDECPWLSPNVVYLALHPSELSQLWIVRFRSYGTEFDHVRCLCLFSSERCRPPGQRAMY